MGRYAYDDRRERSLASRLDRRKERERQEMFHRIRDNIEEAPKKIAQRLIDEQLLETKSRKAIDEQLQTCLEQMLEAEEFDINYSIAPYRQLVHQPNLVGLYVTAFVVEKLINHASVVDVYGDDEQIYKAIMESLEPFFAKRTGRTRY